MRLSPSLIKIDVEGMEPDVLAGARETIARCSPYIFTECWDENLLQQQCAEVAAEYTIYQFRGNLGATPNWRGVVDTHWTEIWTMNALWVPAGKPAPEGLVEWAKLRKG
jgi:hypothetical protein